MSTTDLVLEPFGGPGGWSEGLRMLGHRGIGIELNPWACRTAMAAGHRRIRADVSTFPLEHLRGLVWGVILSPPCKAFSAAGKGDGVEHVAALAAAVDRGEWSFRPDPDPLVWLVLEPLRWIETLRPRWVAMEQVPKVMPIWRAYRRRLQSLGYSAECGVLSAERFGVPQVRKRAFVVASLDRKVTLPEPTHQAHNEDHEPSLFADDLPPPISMADALGWESRVTSTLHTRCGYDGVEVTRDSDDPAPTFTTKSAGQRQFRRTRSEAWIDAGGVRQAEWVYRRTRGEGMTERHGPRDDRPVSDPAPTLTSKLRSDVWALRPGIVDGRNRGHRPIDDPAPTLAFGHDFAAWCWERPSTTVLTSPRIVKPGHKDRGKGGESMFNDAIPVTIPEAGILQSFPADYPWQGTKTAQATQVGDAVPPLLAAAVLSVLV